MITTGFFSAVLRTYSTAPVPPAPCKATRGGDALWILARVISMIPASNHLHVSQSSAPWASRVFSAQDNTVLNWTWSCPVVGRGWSFFLFCWGGGRLINSLRLICAHQQTGPCEHHMRSTQDNTELRSCIGREQGRCLVVHIHDRLIDSHGFSWSALINRDWTLMQHIRSLWAQDNTKPDPAPELRGGRCLVVQKHGRLTDSLGLCWSVLINRDWTLHALHHEWSCTTGRRRDVWLSTYMAFVDLHSSTGTWPCKVFWAHDCRTADHVLGVGEKEGDG